MTIKAKSPHVVREKAMSILTGNPFVPPPFPIHRFTVDEYHQMIQKGILQEDTLVELLDGWIVPKMPRNPPRDLTIDLAQDVIRSVLPAGWRLRIQSAITIDSSEPEPDLAIVRGPAERYLSNHPKPQDIAIVIEVADSSLAHDREEKGKLYAQARIPIYWIINLVNRQVEVYSRPSGPDPSPGYRRREDYLINDSVPLVLAEKEVVQVAVKSLLPATSAPDGQASS
jgi:Uma2 family endonuclease